MDEKWHDVPAKADAGTAPPAGKEDRSGELLMRTARRGRVQKGQTPAIDFVDTKVPPGERW